MDPHTAEETEEAIELDMLNVLPDELDPKVTYREAVRCRFLFFLFILPCEGETRTDVVESGLRSAR